MSEVDYCASPFCQEVGLKKCARCVSVRYCSKDCQTAHWKFHKKSCLPQIQVEELKVRDGICVYEVNIGKFYSGAGIMPQTQTQRIVKETFSRDAANNVIINIFAPKLEAAPVPSIITLPPDAVLLDSQIHASWEADIEARSGEMRCAKISIIFQRGAPALSNPPKTLTIQMIPKAQLPEWFISDKMKKYHGKKALQGHESEINKLLKARGARPLGESSDTDEEEEEEEEEDLGDVVASQKAVNCLKSATSPSSAVTSLQTIISLGKYPSNVQTMINADLRLILEATLSKHKGKAEIVSLVAGLVTNMCMREPGWKPAIMQACLCEELVSCSARHPEEQSLAVISRQWLPRVEELTHGVWQFTVDGGSGVASDPTNVQKWVWSAIMFLAADEESQRRVLGRERGLLEAVVQTTSLHASLEGSYACHAAVSAIGQLCSGPLGGVDDGNREALQALGACELLDELLHTNRKVPVFLHAVFFAIKSMTMSGRNRFHFSTLGTGIHICDALRDSGQSFALASEWGVRAINMLAMQCLANQMQLLHAEAPVLIVELLKLHMKRPGVADACCRAIQNMTCVPESVVVDFGSDVCETVVTCVNTYNGVPTVLLQAINAINNLIGSRHFPHLQAMRALGVEVILESIAASKSYDLPVQTAAKTVMNILINRG